MENKNTYTPKQEVWIKPEKYKRRRRGTYIRFDTEKNKHVVEAGVYHYFLDDFEIEP